MLPLLGDNHQHLILICLLMFPQPTYYLWSPEYTHQFLPPDILPTSNVYGVDWVLRFKNFLFPLWILKNLFIWKSWELTFCSPLFCWFPIPEAANLHDPGYYRKLKRDREGLSGKKIISWNKKHIGVYKISYLYTEKRHRRIWTSDRGKCPEGTVLSKFLNEDW